MVDARTTSGAHETEVARLREAYAALPRTKEFNAPEQFVFDLLENYQRRWGLLNAQEQLDAIRYLEKIGRDLHRLNSRTLEPLH